LNRRSNILAAMALALASLAAPAAIAAADSAPPSDNCFWSGDWEGWKSPSPTVIYLRVGASQVFRLDLKQGSNQLKYPDMHLTNRHQVGGWICTPHDLDLLLSDDHGIYSEPLFVKSITRLTPAEIAAIPHQYEP